VFDDIVDNEHIKARAIAVTQYYDRLIELTARRTAGLDVDQEEIEDVLFLTLVSVNVLEAIRFYVSFACSFSFAERRLMEGNAKIIKLIARDEALHLSGTQNILQMWITGKDDPRMQDAAVRNFNKVFEIFESAAEQEMQWADYLFQHGSMVGLSAGILKDYVRYITNVRIKALGLAPIFPDVANPLPWMNNWLVSDNVAVAPQETEISSYLVGAVDTNLGEKPFEGFSI
jgi:ribonucleoside-diphosphate reductase beta chain